MTSSLDSSWWERHGPRLPSHGIRAHTQRGQFGRTWWAGRWIAALERLSNEGRLARGRTYARVGQVISMDVSRQGVQAVVQGSRPEPYRVTIEFRQLTDAEWERVIDAMASEAIYAARLLSGEMPEQIEEVFASVGASLFPAREGDMCSTCSCPDWRDRARARGVQLEDDGSVTDERACGVAPCKHIAAVYYLLGERFDQDPFLMFLLRGRSQEEIVAALRARRGATDAEGEAPAEEETLTQADIGTFWAAPTTAEEVALHFALPESDALPIKGLGPPSFVRDQAARAAMTAAMERLYQQIGAYALLLAVGDGDLPVVRPGPDDPSVYP